MLKQGIYEDVIKQKMQETERSGLVCVQQQIDNAESPQILANYLAKAIRQKLEDTEEQQDRVNFINRIMIDAGLLDDKQIVKPTDLLAEVMSQQQAALLNQSNSQTVRPISGFRVSNLFTGGSSALSLGEEIRREIKMQGAASGVFNLPEHNATLLFVTLNKSEKDFSPSTQYNDYLINEEYFHWQSQNTDSHNNNGGRRYTEQEQTKNKIILFVREEKKDGFGNTSPFHCFGLVDYISSHGDCPMNVKWKLHKPAMAQYLKAI